MTISKETVTALAPDQASLNAANKLMKPAKWPLREVDAAFAWGECQGSGANPYRVVFDLADHGYKCTCPSRKFPCKHVLALMWMYSDDASGFSDGSTPTWVEDWLGRRRKSGENAKTDTPSTVGKSLSAATLPEVEKAPDPKAEARTRAAAEKRAADTKAALLGAVDDLEIWVADQLRTGLMGLLGDLGRFRAIAARMVDGKAQVLAGRLDETPSELMALPGEERLDALIMRLGKLVLLARAFRSDPDDPATRRAIATAEKREELLDLADALRVASTWQVAGQRIRTRRDGLVSQATYLLNLDPETTQPRFAQLLDFFPASVGKHGTSFATGERFDAELVFYPGPAPLRAVIAERKSGRTEATWPGAKSDPLVQAADHLAAAPWDITVPLVLPEGRIVLSKSDKPWWRPTQSDLALPLTTAPGEAGLGMVLERSTALWDGHRLSLLSSHTPWGLVVSDA
ncbi:MAG: SWIM zinc finger family protein [Pseudomonadota bacterium]